MLANNWVRAVLIGATILLWAGVFALGVQVFGYFADIILIVFFAWLTSFILQPAVGFLKHRGRMPQWAGVVLTYLGAIIVVGAMIVLLVPTLILQSGGMADRLNEWQTRAPGVLDPLEALLAQWGIAANFDGVIGQAGTYIQSTAGEILRNAVVVLQSVGGLIFNIVIILILSIYLLLDGQRMVRRSLALLPTGLRHDAQAVIESIAKNFGAFIRSLFVQGAIYGVLTLVVMVAFGLDFALPVAIFAGFMMAIPFIGPILSILPVIVIGLFSGNLFLALAAIVILFVGQTIITNVIGPRIVGNAIGLHPAVVLVALIVGIRIGGLYGAIFAIPVAGVLYATGLSFYQRFREESAEQKKAEVTADLVLPDRLPVSPAGSSGPPSAPTAPFGR